MTSPRPTSDLPDESVAGRARRPGGRSAAVRRRVLDAALAQLVQHGYDSLSVDVVAERSGVHRTTVYRRWRDVGGLLAPADAHLPELVARSATIAARAGAFTDR